MHTLDFYSLNCGLKAKDPFVMEKFFPYNMEKFISFYPYGVGESRSYSYWREVCRILYPILAAKKISIAQIGPEGSSKVEGCVSLNGQLSYNQCIYMVNHALMHLGVDSFVTQFASSAGKKKR